MSQHGIQSDTFKAIIKKEKIEKTFEIQRHEKLRDQERRQKIEMHTAIADNLRSYFIRYKRRVAVLSDIVKHLKEHLDNEFHGLA